MILVTGGTGQLGQCLKSLKSDKSILFYGSNELDITHFERLRSVVSKVKPKYIINCAAYTQVDKAESEPERTFSINTEGAKNLALIAKEYNIDLIHISTDYVFNGENTTPYKETETCNPIGTYGKSKYEGEIEITNICETSIIIRTSWLYSEFANNFVKSILNHMKNKEKLGVVYDQVGSPTYAKDLARFILHIIDKNLLKNNYGIYHFCNTGITSWFDLTKEIQNIKKINCEISPIESIEYPTPAKRPSYSVLSTKKISRNFNYTIPYWKTSLLSCLQNL